MNNNKDVESNTWVEKYNDYHSKWCKAKRLKKFEPVGTRFSLDEFLQGKDEVTKNEL